MSDELSPEVFDAVCRQADQAARAQERLAQANTEAKNELLLAIADALDEHAADIEAANALDMLESKENGMDAGKLDRLLFDVPLLFETGAETDAVAGALLVSARFA